MNVLDHSYIIEDLSTDYSETFASLHHFFTIAETAKEQIQRDI